MDLTLLDWRRRVADLYGRVRASNNPEGAWRDWVATRDDLFASHPQTPLEDPDAFTGLPHYDYDPSWRVLGQFRPADAEVTGEVAHSSDGTTPVRMVGTISFTHGGRDHDLDAFWLDAYGGGLFLPFRDQTCGDSTYGGGRYLLDTVKGADLGHDGDRLVLDFNFAYHPSCVHSPRWSCPLAPPGNRLDVAVSAGERLD